MLPFLLCCFVGVTKAFPPHDTGASHETALLIVVAVLLSLRGHLVFDHADYRREYCSGNAAAHPTKLLILLVGAQGLERWTRWPE